MTYTHKAVRVFLLIMVSMLVSSNVLADDRDDVLNVVQQWIDLESDLAAQSALHRDDRTWINNMVRRTDEALNMRMQMAAQAAGRKQDPGGELLNYMESPIVNVYGNAAVASFVNARQFLPGNALPRPLNQTFVTLVLIKESGDWKIAHFHRSSGN